MASAKKTTTTNSQTDYNVLATMIETMQQMLQQSQQQQQAIAQALQAMQQTGGSLQADKKALSHEDKTVDIGDDEAWKHHTVHHTRQWDHNDKLISERENTSSRRSEDIQHGREQAKDKLQQILDHVAGTDAMFWSAFRMGIGFEYAKSNLLEPMDKIKEVGKVMGKKPPVRKK